ncbi:CLUMA_CG001367, isoform A [Clunio marinus]|uniref:CLUMA_CG001367, isoform A n=1 Tax=Clunio marinus TaxID=568069 RepID=A0A1J1HJ29_9DIPT|nr:CLUMA_CG001367, isoform A [Clunio marinus]
MFPGKLMALKCYPELISYVRDAPTEPHYKLLLIGEVRNYRNHGSLIKRCDVHVGKSENFVPINISSLVEDKRRFDTKLPSGLSKKFQEI